jgi:hypothetical protein
LIATNQTPEERSIKPGAVYVYDKKEDKNFKIADEFQSIPDDWFVILTDIVNSTEHFKDERYQEVNFVAVAGASIVLNEAHLHRIHVPFVYGGDGVTVFVPPALVPSLKTKLATLRSNAHKRFGMNLRISIIPVSEIYKAGFSIRTAKLYISKSYNQSIFLGEGIRYAESLMKKTEEYLLPQHIKQRPIDLSGLECKWNALFPPRSGDEILSLIVLPHGHREPEEVFHDIFEKREAYLEKAREIIKEYSEKYGEKYLGIKKDHRNKTRIEYVYPITISRKP